MSPEALEQFQRLHAFDRTHLIAVASSLLEQGASDDLVTAGLLHDIGKADQRGEIRLADRVIFAVIPKSLSRRIAPIRIMSRLFPGLPLLATHATIGANWLEAWDYPPRVAWLIRNHELTNLGDPELDALVHADEHGIGPTD